MEFIIPGNNGFFKELASLVLQTEAIVCLEKYIPLGPEWILPLFDTAHIENSYFFYNFAYLYTESKARNVSNES